MSSLGIYNEKFLKLCGIDDGKHPPPDVMEGLYKRIQYYWETYHNDFIKDGVWMGIPDPMLDILRLIENEMTCNETYIEKIPTGLTRSHDSGWSDKNVKDESKIYLI